MLARELKPGDVVLTNGAWRIITATRTWCGLITADLLGGTTATWRTVDEVQTTSPIAEPLIHLQRGEGIILDANSNTITD